LQQEFLSCGEATGLVPAYETVGFKFDGFCHAGLQDALAGVHLEVVGSGRFYLGRGDGVLCRRCSCGVAGS
jgi:hypothetical protein